MTASNRMLVHAWWDMWRKCDNMHNFVSFNITTFIIPYSCSYEVGARYKLNDCSECTCLMGGHAQCHNYTCPPCKSGLRAVQKQACVCSCEPCRNGEVLCVTSGVCIPETSWCDGIRDCPDDELNCAEQNAANKTTVHVVEKISELFAYLLLVLD